jgi:hypothetical protein
MWFVMGVPSIVYHTLVIPGHLTEEVYEWIWTWCAPYPCSQHTTLPLELTDARHRALGAQQYAHLLSLNKFR